ncbi:MAG: winged helix-turn-helix domain-containing protein [Bryobacteraceae bacterium]
MSPRGQTDASTPSARVRFGPFDFDPATGELHKHGIRRRLPGQAYRILCALLERPGEVIPRDTLRQRLWPGETSGDFEQGLNRAVNKLRELLADTAANPRFIETLPGRGYRFIGVVEGRAEGAAPPAGRPRRIIIAAAAALAVLAAAVVAARFMTPPSVAPLRWRKVTTDNYAKIPPALSDGARIYFAASFGGEQFIAQAPLSGGHPARVPITTPGPVFTLQDLSPDGQEFLVTAAGSGNRLGDMPLWTLRIADGSARRLGSITATSAAYAPSGTRVAYSNPASLWIADRSGSDPRRLLEVSDGVLGSVCWSPDENRIRFSRADPMTNQASAWEVGVDGGGLRRVFPAWDGQSHRPAGWIASPPVGLFAGEGAVWGISEAWSFFPNTEGRPDRLIDDAPEFTGAIRPRGNEFYVMGTDRLGELQQYDRSAGAWTPLLEGISAEAVEYSPDSARVAYVTYPQRTLWVRQAGGERPIQLTSAPLAAAFPRWSRDGKRIAFSAAESAGKPMRLYIVDADGGAVRPAVPSESGSQGYPSWSPDGGSLLYGIVSSSTREVVFLRIANLETGKVTRLEGSGGLFAPRWSPDGRTIAALQWEGEHHLMLYHVAAKRWEEVAGRRVDWPTWAPDSSAILCRIGDDLTWYRIATGKFDHAANLGTGELGGHWRWVGIGADNALLRTLNRDNRQIYALQLPLR